MNRDKAREIAERLPGDALVLDVGGGGSPFYRADYVIDMLPYDERGALVRDGDAACRATEESWIKADICDRSPWPFTDKKFDYATCSHVLEDIRDPIWVCSEMVRVAKAGYIEVPSRIVEQSLGVEHPCYAGFYHHRWLIDQDSGFRIQDSGDMSHETGKEKQRLVFRHKPHSLHSFPPLPLRGSAETSGWRALQ